MPSELDFLVENAPQRVRAFVDVFNRHPPSKLIGDAETQVEYLEIDGLAFPISLNTWDDGNRCYLCSPSLAFIDYGLEELRHFKRNRILDWMLRRIIKSCAPIVRGAGLDNQVQVNNWLFSTNPVPAITSAQAQNLRDELCTTYLNKTIIIRSLNARADQETIKSLQSAGFKMLGSRQVYIVDQRMRPSKSMKEDLRKIAKSKYVFVPTDKICEADYEQGAKLYAMLYLDKYTDLNPHYTPLYLKEMHQAGLLVLEGFRDDKGILVAITGYFQNGKTLTQPIVGYDTSKSHQEGLYRMVMALGQNYAKEHNLFFNLSAGAADFKRRRNATPEIEYMAVYARHLGWRQKASLAIIQFVLNKIGVPIMRKFEL